MRLPMPDDRELADSYEHCRRLARAAARNFYYGFALLPGAKRDALCALYAFMRHADDISDSDQAIKDKSEGLKMACRARAGSRRVLRQQPHLTCVSSHGETVQNSRGVLS